jgi:hypothetical protein
VKLTPLVSVYKPPTGLFDAVAGARGGAADGHAGGAADPDAAEAVAQREGAARVGADVVALDQGAGHVVGDLDAVAVVAGDDVALGRRDPADTVVAAAEYVHAVGRVAPVQGAGGVGADVVADDDVVGAPQADTGVDVVRQHVARRRGGAADEVAGRGDVDAEVVHDRHRGGAVGVQADHVAGDEVVVRSRLEVQPETIVAVETVDRQTADR